MNIRAFLTLSTWSTMVVLTGCAGRVTSTAPVLPASTQSSSDHTELNRAVLPSSVSFIYDFASPPSFSPVRLRKYTEQGRHVDLEVKSTLNAPIEAVYDPHDRLIYVIDSYYMIKAFDLKGNQVSLTGSFPGATGAVLITFDSRTNHLYIANEPNQSGPVMLAFDEQGNSVPATGGFPNLGTGADAMSYDAHNGLIYYIGNTPSACFVHAYNGRGDEEKLSGKFPGLLQRENLTYNSGNGLLYVSQAAASGGFGTVVAYDEEGNPQALSPGFPTNMSAGEINYDPSNGWLYVVVGTQIEAFDQNGNKQTLTGYFGGKRTLSGVFVIAP